MIVVALVVAGLLSVGFGALFVVAWARVAIDAARRMRPINDHNRHMQALHRLTEKTR